MQLALEGNLEIGQFTVTEPGLYAWRSCLSTDERRSGTEWTLGHLNPGDKIGGQFEGCGPFLLKAK